MSINQLIKDELKRIRSINNKTNNIIKWSLESNKGDEEDWIRWSKTLET